MPTLQSSTGRHLLFVAAFVGLAFAVDAASAIDPDQRGRLAAAEPPLAGKAASAPKDGEKKIFVRADTPIVIYEPGDKTDLKPGAKVFIIAAKQPDGTLQGRAWRVGRHGVTPPM